MKRRKAREGHMPDLGAKYREAIEATRAHLVGLARLNASWHRDAYRRTGDRYHLGQWKAYSRAALRLDTVTFP